MMYIHSKIKAIILLIVATSGILQACASNNEFQVKPQDGVVNIIFISDQHYGITRTFDGKIRTSDYVNSIMLKAVNSLPETNLPADGGVGASQKIGAVEMIINGGDITNRMQDGVQTASASWAEFRDNFMMKVSTRRIDGLPTEFFIIPGNHDVSNAIGYTKPLAPATDATSMAEIYNMMVKPSLPIKVEEYDYAANKVRAAIDRFGIRFLFINIWPSTEERVWMDSQLDAKPVLIFAHDEPAIELKHLTNPNPPYGINSTDKYENMISDKPETPGTTLPEQRKFAEWVAKHPSIKAYFHGNTNYNEFYVYNGPENDIALNCFRVDSPMKGEVSGDDQSKLSFHVITIDSANMTMSVRECFWGRGNRVEWGQVKTISLK